MRTNTYVKDPTIRRALMIRLQHYRKCRNNLRATRPEYFENFWETPYTPDIWSARGMAIEMQGQMELDSTRRNK